MLDVRLSGLEDIAAEFRTSPGQVLRWADTRRPRRPLAQNYRDPLRLQWLHGRPILRRSAAAPWRRRNRQGGEGERKLHGWEAICDRAELTRQGAWIASERADDPLPVVRTAEGKVWAYESAVDEWKAAQTFSRDVHQLVSAARRVGRGLPPRPERRSRLVSERKRGQGPRSEAEPEEATGDRASARETQKARAQTVREVVIDGPPQEKCAKVGKAA